MAEVSDEVAAIPALKTNAGPRDTENWTTRVKEEYLALIQYIKQNKDRDNDWFKLESNKYENIKPTACSQNLLATNLASILTLILSTLSCLHTT